MEDQILLELLEAGMVVCFGVAWPISIRKSVKSKTSRGKSLAFLIIVIVGYLLGITRKVLTGSYQISFYAYCLNILMVSADAVIWFYNYQKYDKPQPKL